MKSRTRKWIATWLAAIGIALYGILKTVNMVMPVWVNLLFIAGSLLFIVLLPKSGKGDASDASREGGSGDQ